MPVLYIDVLGMKARWRTGDLASVRAAYTRFEKLVKDGLAELSADVQFDGGIQSDAAAIVFANADSAVRVGCSIFRAASAIACRQERFWLRGVIVQAPAQFDSLEHTCDYSNCGGRLRVRHFSDELLAAVLVEQSGPKGGRLLIAEDLITQKLRDTFAMPFCGSHLVPFRRLDNSTYPDSAVGVFHDVLWMLPNPCTDTGWDSQRRLMDGALRWAGRAAAESHRDEEFAHAAATELVFKECDAIIGHLRLRRQERLG